MARTAVFRTLACAVVILCAGVVGGCAGVLTPAIAPGTRLCTGMPEASCAQAFQEADAQARDRGTIVVGIVVRCTGLCTDANGAADRFVRYADGTTDQGGFGWSSAGPAPVGLPIGPDPTPAVAPTCIGIPIAKCLEMALGMSSAGDQRHADIVSIVVRCKPGPCTATTGDGETTFAYADGTSTTSDWAYRGAP